MTIHSFSFPTNVRFGLGARHEVASALERAGVTRPFVVIDKNLPSLDIFKALIEELATDVLTPIVHTDFRANPLDDDVAKGVQAYRDNRADGLLAIGGGVAMDVGKAIGLMVNNPGSLFDYEDGPNAQPVNEPFPYFIAIPTTSGTGSEVGRSTVISDQNKVKRVLFTPKMLPREVFADPEVTVGLPASITAGTGMDALTHCVEAYLAKGYHPLCDGIALHGIQLVSKSLTKAVKNGGDLEARADMMAAAMMGALAFQKGLGVNHSLAHSLSQICDTHHGLANGVILQESMRFNRETVPERFEQMARVLGLESGEAFIAWIEELKASIGIPENLRAIGVKEDQLEALAAAAFRDTCHQCNPRDCSQADLLALFKAAF